MYPTRYVYDVLRERGANGARSATFGVGVCFFLPACLPACREVGLGIGLDFGAFLVFPGVGGGGGDGERRWARGERRLLIVLKNGLNSLQKRRNTLEKPPSRGASIFSPFW